jgi:hypothetical protein
MASGIMADRRTLTNPVVHGLRIHVLGVSSPLPPLAAPRYHADASRFLISQWTVVTHHR